MYARSLNSGYRIAVTIYLLPFFSKSIKPVVRNSTLVQPGRNMSKLLNVIMTNYDRNMRPFYGGEHYIRAQYQQIIEVSISSI